MDSSKVGSKFPSFPVTREAPKKGSVPATGSMPSTGQKGGQTKGSGTKA